MGFFKDIHIEIMNWRAQGRTIEETYIYFKDYIEFEDLIAVWEENYDQEPKEIA